MKLRFDINPPVTIGIKYFISIVTGDLISKHNFILTALHNRVESFLTEVSYFCARTSLFEFHSYSSGT